jgi:hypothetical protein
MLLFVDEGPTTLQTRLPLKVTFSFSLATTSAREREAG